MSKPFASRRFVPAGWVLLGLIATVALLAAAGIASLRAHRGSTAAKPVAPAQAPVRSAEQRGRVQASLGALPLAFEANQGQTDPQVKYMARGNGYTVFLTANDTVFALQSSAKAATRRANGQQAFGKALRTPAAKDATAAIRMHLVGGNAQPQISAGNQLPGHSNYFIGNDRRQWHSNVAQFARVSYRDVYPGVNLAFYGKQKQLEFDFIVAPGASITPIRLGVSGAKRVVTDDSGNLILASSAGDVLLHKPVAYQQKDGARQPVDARFVLQARNQVSFELDNYDRSRELVIDPAVSYATYLGGTLEDDAYGIAIDTNGDAYVTGQTTSTNFPTVAGGFKTTNSGVFDAFVTKVSANGSSLVYSTYVGGSGQDSGNAIAVDASGNAFVAGGTGSTDFPHIGGFQTSLKGGLDAFVFELNSSGTALTYSTYLGGAGNDYASGIALHGGDAYIVGSTFSSDFPTANPIQSMLKGSSNGFVAAVNSSGSALVYSTYLGAGTGDFASAVAVDSSGNAYVTGATPNPSFPVTSSAFQKTCGSDGTCNGGLPDAFVTVINAAGNAYVYSTFLGGERIDQGLGIAVDSAGDAYVTGLTQSSGHFPLKSPLQATFGGGTQDVFVTELNPTGSALVYSTFLGGSLSDAGTAIALDGSNNAYVTGQTNSTNFPLKNATQGSPGGLYDAFVTEINASGAALLFSTYLGGTQNENTNSSGANLASIGAIAVDSAGANVYVAGNTASTNFPATPGSKQTANGGGTDAFVAKYSLTSTGPDFTIAGSPLPTTTQGGTSTSTITITAVNNYSGTVNFTCSVAAGTGGSPLPTCSVPNATVTGATGTSTLSVTTTGTAGAMNRGTSSLLYAMWLPVVGLSLVGMRFSTAGSRRKKLLGFLLLGLIMAALFFLPACSSSNSGGGGGGCPGCTPQGSYTVTVTGTDSQNPALTHSVSPALTLNVN
ncbi:MAG: SBBP repeat-containing protein [Candidatus Sulfotelmatobacter sp.]